MPETQPPLWLYAHVTGRSNQAELEDQIPRAIAMASPAIEGVYLFVPSWQEAPDIAHGVAVREIVDACGLFSLNLVWCRQLWNTHGDQNVNDHITPAYYVAAMQRLASEAGNAQTCLDVEPYGGPMVEAFKTGVTITRDLHLCIVEAIELACQYAPRPTFVTPGYHRLPDHWRWAFSRLAPKVLSQSSYRVRDPNHRYMDYNPPAGHTCSVTHPGFWLAPPESQAGQNVPVPWPLTVPEFRDLDWAAWKAKFPDIKSVWIYTDRNDLLEVCRQLGEDQ